MTPHAALEEALRTHVQTEEALASKGADSLWGHLQRAAAIAEQLGRAEGLDPATCRLAALFHDAGKFHRGSMHGDSLPEEHHSVTVLDQLARAHGLADELVAELSAAILALYRDDAVVTPLSGVLFDADNLDKLGHLGIANFFVKRGLRGRGVDLDFLVQFTVELTYARHAVACMYTAAGRRWAERRAPQTREFLLTLLEQLRDDGLADMVVKELTVDGLIVDAVVPRACACGGELHPESWHDQGISCTKIHLVHVCDDCEECHEVHFCRPRLAVTSAD